MTARDERVPGSDKLSKGDKYSIVIAMASLLVSFVALGITLYLWYNTRPADPTLIPHFGESGDLETIDAGDGGRRFFEFLDKHPDRKIRIYASIGEGVEVRQTDLDKKHNRSTAFSIRRECKPEQVRENEPECDADVLFIKSEDEVKEASGLESKSGWVLEGYFASAGLISRRQGEAIREIAEMSIVTAVS